MLIESKKRFSFNNVFLVLGIFVFLTSITYPPSSHAIIKEIQSIDEVKSYVDKNTLLVLDLDNTIVRPKQFFGSDEWYNLRLKDFLKEYSTHKEAQEAFAPLYQKASALTEEKLIEPKSLELIKEYQKAGIFILVLTSRDKSEHDCTVQKLNRLGLTFNQEKELSEISYRFLDRKESEAFGQLIFAGGENKGRILLEYLNYLKTSSYFKDKLKKLNKIVFVDDKEKYLHQLDQYVNLIGVDKYYGLRYARLDRKIAKAKAEDMMAIAMIQEEFMGKIISNNVARAILHARNDIKVK